VRVAYNATESVTVIAAILDGDPAGPGPGDPHARDRHGLNFRVTDPPLVIGETQVKFGDKDGPVLPGVFKIGGWRHFGRFSDLRLGSDLLSLAAPTSNGLPLQRRADHGVYAVVDQQVYALRGEGASKGVGVFGRALIAPSDRNLVDFYLDGGVNFAGVIAGRQEDSFGVAIAYARISPVAAAFDRYTAFHTGQSRPVRDREMALEATYNAQVVPGWYVQPNIQFISHPGGNVPNPFSPSHQPVRDAFVVGLQTTIKY
jgi:porin